MKLTASGVANCAAITRSPSFSRSSPSQTTTMRPRRISSIASSIVENGLSPASARRPLSCCVSVIWLTLAPFRRMVPPTAPRTSPRCRTRRSACVPAPASPRLVRSSVSGISETSTQSSPSSATVRLTPLERDRALARPRSAAARGRARRGGAGRSRPRSTETTSPTPSTWPWTMWPPSRSEACIASSRLTRPPASRPPSAVTSSVWFIASVSKPSASASVAVRQTPLTATESPSAISRAERGRDAQPRALAAARRAPRPCRCPGSAR